MSVQSGIWVSVGAGIDIIQSGIYVNTGAASNSVLGSLLF